jgi:hypothetical protein
MRRLLIVLAMLAAAASGQKYSGLTWQTPDCFDQKWDVRQGYVECRKEALCYNGCELFVHGSFYIYGCTNYWDLRARSLQVFSPWGTRADSDAGGFPPGYPLRVNYHYFYETYCDQTVDDRTSGPILIPSC